MKIVYMGTPDFAVPALEKLMESNHEVGYVVTQPDRRRNRGKKTVVSPVKEAALKGEAEVLQPEKIKEDRETIDTLKAYQPDFIIVAAYGQILSKEILDIPKYGCINIHGSLLPRWRGAAPIQFAVLSGDPKTGVTIMKMAEGLDTGDMLVKAETEIGKKTAEDLHDELADMGAELLAESLQGIADGSIKGEKQDDSLSTYAGMINKKDAHIDFAAETAEEIERRIRAFTPWPGAYSILDGKNMKIRKAEVFDKKSDASPSTIINVSDEGIDVASKEGVLRMTVIQMPGKRVMKTADYLRGNSIEEGTVLE